MRARVPDGRRITVLPYDPARDRVMVVEQFRMVLIARGSKPLTLEPIAGRQRRGETPEDPRAVSR